jgi:hypothetical protein
VHEIRKKLKYAAKRDPTDIREGYLALEKASSMIDEIYMKIHD